jgi:hypothetical protein
MNLFDFRNSREDIDQLGRLFMALDLSDELVGLNTGED